MTRFREIFLGKSVTINMINYLQVFILQTARIYSRATDKSILLAVRSRDSLQVLSMYSLYTADCQDLQ